MATLRESILDEVARECDRPYSWPENTCCEMLFRYMERIGGPNLRDGQDRLMEMGERKATATIIRNYGSWFGYGVVCIEADGAFSRVHQVMPGDIVGMSSSKLETSPMIGIAHRRPWVFVQGLSGVLPISVAATELRSVWRYG